MTFPGKNAPGLKGFPTPNSPADTAAYLLVLFPDSEWVQYLLGAMKTLTSGYNWYESGDLSPDEAAEMFRLIVQDAPYNKVTGCALPSGQPLMRVNASTGKIQNVDDEGNWQDDPDIPPTPARPPDPPEDQKCLAAANAAHALELLYENLSDSFNSGLSTAEAISNFVAAAALILGAVFEIAVAALVAIGRLLFEVVYEVVAFIGADVWTEDFTAKLQCMLYDCSSVADDVVSFDFQCVINELAAQTDVFDLTLSQIRLFGQLYYILSFIGGDGLNYAGSATAIAEATCNCAWCRRWLDGQGQGAWDEPTTLYGRSAGSYDSGADEIIGTVINELGDVWAAAQLIETLHVTQIKIWFDFDNTGAAFGANGLIILGDGVEIETDLTGTGTGSSTIEWNGDATFDEIQFLIAARVSAEVTKIQIRGLDDEPSTGGICDE